MPTPNDRPAALPSGAPGARMSASPWWYRNRGAVSGMLYGAGFWIPNLITNRRYVPTFDVLGSRLGGPAGINLAFAAGVVIVAVGFLIRLWGSSYLRPVIVWNADAKADRIVVEGPFRFTRNPLYFGNMLMAVGIGFVAPPVGFAIIVIGHAILVNALIYHEEPIMRARFGEEYLRYCAVVPRFWPRPRPVSETGSHQPSLVQGLHAEFFTACFVLAMWSLFVGMPYGMIGCFTFCIAGTVAQQVMAP